MLALIVTAPLLQSEPLQPENVEPEAGTAVNVTLGLPIIRTSVDHGTAFDIAWKGIASSRNLVSAMNLAEKLARGDS